MSRSRTSAREKHSNGPDEYAVAQGEANKLDFNLLKQLRRPFDNRNQPTNLKYLRTPGRLRRSSTPKSQAALMK